MSNLPFFCRAVCFWRPTLRFILGTVLGLGALSAHTETVLSRWDNVKSEDSCEGYLAFIEEFPDSPIVGLAKAKATEKRCSQAGTVTQPIVATPQAPEEQEGQLWARSRVKNECAGYQRYLTEYPEGTYAEQARHRARICDQPLSTQPLDNSAPLAAVDAYYRALDQADASAALSMWVSAPSSVARFVSENEFFRVNSRRLVSNDGNDAKVFVDVTGKSRGARAERWRLYVHLTRVGDVWKIDRMRVH